MQEFGLSKTETLQLVNLRPTSEVELYVVSPVRIGCRLTAQPTTELHAACAGDQGSGRAAARPDAGSPRSGPAAPGHQLSSTAAVLVTLPAAAAEAAAIPVPAAHCVQQHYSK